MKKSKRRLLAGIGAVLGCLVVGSFVFGQTKIIDITVDDPRPLAAAILKIEELSGIPINYEDVPVYYSGDLHDVTDLVVRTPLPPGRRIIAPLMRHFSVPIVVDAATGKLNDAQAVRESLLRLISEYRSENLPGSFDIEASNGVFFVKPAQCRDATGAARPMAPVLSAPVTLPEERRRITQTMRMVLDQVSKAAGVQVGPGMGLDALGEMTFGAQNETADHAIARFLASRSRTAPLPPNATWDIGVSYTLLFDSNFRFYALNVHRARKIDLRRGPPYSPPTRPSGPNPWFSK